jgi:hypothetical protein
LIILRASFDETESIVRFFRQKRLLSLSVLSIPSQGTCIQFLVRPLVGGIETNIGASASVSLSTVLGCDHWLRLRPQ